MNVTITMNLYKEPKLSRILRNILYIFGLWPRMSWNTLYRTYSYILHFVTSFTVYILLSINLVTSINDVDRFTASIFPVLKVWAYIFKLINYYYYAENIINCSTKLMKIQKSSGTNESVFHDKLKRLNQVSFFCYFLSNLVLFVGGLKTLVGTTGELPIPSWYPLDWKGNRLHFWIVFIHEIMGGFICNNCNLAMDCYVYYLMAMAAAQFQILYIHIQCLGMNIDRKRDGKELANISSSIKSWIREHQQILELVSDIDRCFSMHFFSQICLSAVMLSGGIYQLSTVSPLENSSKFTFLIVLMMNILIQTFLFTYYGNGILTTSDLLSNAVYSSNWYVMPPVLRKVLIIILERLQRQCQLLAGKFFPLNLTVFTSIINFAYSLYALLKSTSS